MVWTVTTDGRDEAARILDRTLEPPPRSFDPSAMQRHFALTELYVGLLAAKVEADLARVPPRLTSPQRKKALAGLYARAHHRGWRWHMAGDIVELHWTQQDDGGTKAMVQLPGVVLELVQSRRRLFIECETPVEALGGAGREAKAGSLLARLARWERYLCGIVDLQANATWYQRRFHDGYAPEVVFLVWSDRRAVTAGASIEEWQRKSRAGTHLAARALSLGQALKELLPLSGHAAPAAKDGSVDYLKIRNSDALALNRFVASARADLLERRKIAAAANKEPPRVPDDYERVKGLVISLQDQLHRNGQ